MTLPKYGKRGSRHAKKASENQSLQSGHAQVSRYLTLQGHSRACASGSDHLLLLWGEGASQQYQETHGTVSQQSVGG